MLGRMINEKTYVCCGVVGMFVNPRLDNAVEFEVKLYTISLAIENEGVVENVAGIRISDVCVVVNTPVKVLSPLKEEYDARAVFRRAIVSYGVKQRLSRLWLQLCSNTVRERSLSRLWLQLYWNMVREQRLSRLWLQLCWSRVREYYFSEQ